MTPLQIETLKLVDAGKVTYVRHGTGAWRVNGASPAAAGKLERTLKLIERGEMIIQAKDYYRYRLTDAGRAALAAS